jgi:hypothetical protein
MKIDVDVDVGEAFGMGSKARKAPKTAAPRR